MFYPIMIDIHEKNIVVVGGGKVSYRKAKNLLKYGGNVTILSPDIIYEFKELKNIYKDNLQFIYNVYEKKYIEDAFLVIGSTSSSTVNQQISKDCKSLNILSNIVDSKEESDFITPSIINNDNFTISISTMGSFPYLSKKIRIDMEKKYGKFTKEYTDTLEEIRNIILNKYPDKTKKIMDKALELELEDLKELLEKLQK